MRLSLSWLRYLIIPAWPIKTVPLTALQRLEPTLGFAVERFRPNLLIEPTACADGFVEETRSGITLAIGERQPASARARGHSACATHGTGRRTREALQHLG